MEEKSVTNMVTGQQQFNLRWNNHTNNILQVFMEQYANEGLVDVTIACDGHFIKAHKMVLSACSPYFQEIFKVHTVTNPLIIINGMKYTDLKQIIEFMYRGEVKVLESELDSLLSVAESLQVKGLSTVRNNPEKEETQTNSTERVERTDENNDEDHSEGKEEGEITDDETNRGAKRKKSKSEEGVKTEEVSDDESLASSIKIEPPEIKDIDQEDAMQVDTSDEGTVSFTCFQTIKKNRSEQQTSEIKLPKKRSPKSGKQITTTFIPILPKNLAPKAFVQKHEALKIAKVSKVPRPPNAFMIFANEWRRRLASEHPKESNKEISVRLGIMWKNLSPDQKENYYSASRKADEEHKRKYPGYYYSPKEARIRKNLKVLEGARKARRELDAMNLVKLVMVDPVDFPRALTANHSSSHQQEESGDEEMEDDPAVNTSDDIEVEIKDDSDTRNHD